MKELALVKKTRQIPTKSGGTGFIHNFESVNNIGTFFNDTEIAVGTEVMVQKNGEYYDFSPVATDAEAAKIKAASAKIKAMWS
jgi:hypothetical protein